MSEVTGSKGEGLSFGGRRVVVTGGAYGIGAATARRLITLGATLVVLDIERCNEQDHAIVVDLADQSAVLVAARQAVEIMGGVDTLINCAGVAHPNELTELDWDAYHRTLTVNLHAPLMLMRELCGRMRVAQYGRVVNVTSIHARFTEPGSLAYDVSKAGLEAATRTAAIELAPDGVLVNAVAPGFVSTRMSVVDGVDELKSDDFQDIYVRKGRLPLRRAAEPEEVAETIVWLASPSNTYVTGQVLTVDGGLTARF